MIRVPLFLAVVFCVLLTVEMSVLWVFEGWLAAIPLMMIAGFLVMQRAGIPEGIAWFCALAFLRADIVAGAIAIVSPFVVLRVFSTRSLYALFGIGLTAHAAGIFALLVVHTVITSTFHTSWNIAYTTLWLQELLLIPGLYIGMMFLRWFEETVSSRVALKPLT